MHFCRGMEKIDNVLRLLSEHWEVLGLLMLVLFTGGYTVSRWRASGMRKLISAHNAMLDDLDNNLREVRKELNLARKHHSEALARAYTSEATAARLQQRVLDLTEREKELLALLNNNQ